MKQKNQIWFYPLIIMGFVLMLAISCKKDEKKNTTPTPPSPTATVTDIEGNIYNTIKIGTQTWMMENLKVTKYNDGTAIPLVTDEIAWSNLSTPGYCWYNNDKVTYTANKYGALYNWFVVITGKLAPTGWHVPSDAEWTTLENYLIANGYNYDGSTTGNYYTKSLAATTNWTSYTGIGTVGNTDYPAKRNSTDFTALPGGGRGYDGTFYGIGSNGGWWSSTEYSTSYAWYRLLTYSSSNVNRYAVYKRYGFSVRCLRD